MSKRNDAMIGVRTSFATLGRATRFLGAGLRAAECMNDHGARVTSIEGEHRARVIGNGLRELDRFLSLMIDEVAALIAPPGLDRACFSRQRNTANKLRTIRSALALPSPDHDRLLALGRSRDCLVHCNGIVCRGDSRATGWMTIGWPAPDGTALHAVAVGERLTISALELHGVCRFYDHVATDLLATCEMHLPSRLLGQRNSPASR